MIQQPPPVQLPTLDAQDAAAAQSDPNHAYYWAYGDWAGGWTLDFGHYKGMPMNELPYYDYLLWTEENCHTERVSFQHALYQYTMGLQDQVNKCPGDFIIPFESQHCGKCIKDCGDAFLRFLVAKRKTPEEVQKYELFYLALQNYLNQLANQTIQNLELEDGSDREHVATSSSHSNKRLGYISSQPTQGSSSRLNFGLLTPSSSQTQQDLQLSPRKQNAKGLQSPRNQRYKESVPYRRTEHSITSTRRNDASPPCSPPLTDPDKDETGGREIIVIDSDSEAGSSTSKSERSYKSARSRLSHTPRKISRRTV